MPLKDAYLFSDTKGFEDPYIILNRNTNTLLDYVEVGSPNLGIISLIKM